MTLRDALKRAKREPAERARWMREAEAQADGARDWIDIAEDWAAFEPDEARRCVAAALAQRDHDSMTFMAAARIVGRLLGDRAHARELLDRCLELLRTSKERAYAWRNLAARYADTCDDREAARSCLDLGLTMSSGSVEDLCTFMDGYMDLGDHETGHALLARAEARATAGDWFAIFHAYKHQLKDEARAWQIVEEALAAVTDVNECLRIARQAETTRPDLVVAALAKAETLAKEAREWLHVADDYYERLADQDAIKRCLERAVAAVPAGDSGDRLRSVIAQAYRLRLGDDDAADRIWPRGAAPDRLLVPVRTLAGWQADRGRLFDWLRSRITLEQLTGIAGADWGNGFHVHLAALVEIQKTGLIPQPLTWYPREVLELRRWSEGESTDHLARAFVCSVLCLDGPTEGLDSSMIVLVDSCRVLGDEAVAAAIGLLVALCESLEDFRSELPLARLALLVAAAARDPHDARLPALCSRVLEAEPRDFGLRAKLWMRLIDDVLASIPHFAPIAKRLRAP